MAVPYIFANTPGGASIPLSHLDDDFAYVLANSGRFQTDVLTVTGLNTVSNLSRTPNSGLFLLILNGLTFVPAGSPAPFSVSGTTITWSSTVYSINNGDNVVAIYSY